MGPEIPPLVCALGYRSLLGLAPPPPRFLHTAFASPLRYTFREVAAQGGGTRFGSQDGYSSGVFPETQCSCRQAEVLRVLC